MQRLPLVLSITAIVIAVLGTTSVGQAVVNAVPINSVGSLQLKRGAVVNAKIGANAVTSDKVKNGSLLKGDFKAGQLPAGPTGPEGPAGTAGAVGAVGISDYEIVSGASASGSGTVQGANVSCPAGKKAIGGGATTSVGAVGGPMVQKSRPFDNGGGWEATGVEASAYAGNWVTTAWAICAKIAG
jgi:hypothetical protein